jgi:hypothetical protein
MTWVISFLLATSIMNQYVANRCKSFLHPHSAQFWWISRRLFLEEFLHVHHLHVAHLNLSLVLLHNPQSWKISS